MALPWRLGGLDLCPPQSRRATGGDQHELAAARSHIPRNATSLPRERQARAMCDRTLNQLPVSLGRAGA
jgi:hypothetical protein